MNKISLIIYEPYTPAIEILGHAGFGEPGKDIVCAALSVLMYTLMDAEPETKIVCGSGWARLSGRKEASGSFALIARGYRLMAQNYPEYVIFQEIKNVRRIEKDQR